MRRRTSPRAVPHFAALGFAACLLAAPAGARAQGGGEGSTVSPSLAQAEVDFTYGLAAYRDGDLDEAERLFRRAVAYDPEHGGAWWGLGLVHLSRGEGDDAHDAFRRSLEARRPPPVPRSEVREEMARASRATAPSVVPLSESAGLGVVVQGLPRWEGRVGAVVGHDTNPAVLPDGLEAVLSDGTRVPGGTSDTVGSLDLRLAVHPFYDRGGWSLELGVEGRQSLHDELDVLDLRRTRGFAHLSWGGDPAGYMVGPLGASRVPLGDGRFALLLQAALSDDELDGEPFSTVGEAGASLTFREAPRTSTQLDLGWRDEDFDRPSLVLFDPLGRFAGEREETSVGLSQWFWFGTRSGYLRIGGRAAERDAGGDFDSQVVGASAEVSAVLSPRTLLFLLGSWEREEYDVLESNPLFGSFFADAPREDESLRAAAAVSFGLAPRLWLTLHGQWLERDVSLGSVDEILDLDRDRTLAAVSLRWFFDGGRVER